MIIYLSYEKAETKVLISIMCDIQQLLSFIPAVYKYYRDNFREIRK